MTVLLLVAALTGYAVGMLSPAMYATRRRGIDLRDVGSGNPGATNVGRALGRRAGVVVGLLDMAKGLVPAVLFGVLAHQAGLVAGLAAVLGHVTSPLLRGRGGKGVATAAGALLGSHPAWAPVVLLTWVVVLAGSRWVAGASICASLAVLVVALVVREDVAWAAVLAGIVVVRHAGNIVRLLRRAA